MIQSKKWLVLDCNYLCHRAKYTTGNLSFEGNATGIIFGFLKEVVYFQEKFNTPHIIFCWDSVTSKRKEIFPKYKISRSTKFKEMTREEIRFEKDFRKQMKNLRKKYLPAIGFSNVFIQKGFESDDVIASICKQFIYTNDEAIIISADKDLFQLISYNTSIYNPQKNEHLTLQKFTSKYGIKPRQWIMVKAFAGCSSDEIPGLKGVGEKTVIKYIKGKLKSKTKACKLIQSEEGRMVLQKNKPLVKLPFKGTDIFKLRKDKLSEQGWMNVTEKLGMKTIKEKIPFHNKGFKHE